MDILCSVLVKNMGFFWDIKFIPCKSWFNSSQKPATQLNGTVQGCCNFVNMLLQKFTLCLSPATFYTRLPRIIIQEKSQLNLMRHIMSHRRLLQSYYAVKLEVYNIITQTPTVLNNHFILLPVVHLC